MPGIVTYDILSLPEPSHQNHSSSPVSLHSDESLHSYEKNFYSISDFDLDSSYLDMNFREQEFDPQTSISMSMFDSGFSHTSIGDSCDNHHGAIISSNSNFPLPSSDESAAHIMSHANVPEFLFQLTKMLSQEHTNIIEWVAGKSRENHPY